MSDRLFHPAAREELRAAAAFYRGISRSLARAFVADVRFAADRIAEFPRSGAPLEDEIRRVRCRRFPFGLIYRHTERSIEILAVMHLHREPFYWRGRVTPESQRPHDEPK